MPADFRPRQSVHSDREPWTWVRTAEVSVTIALGTFVAALGVVAFSNNRSDNAAWLLGAGGGATVVAIVAAKDRKGKLVKWAFGLAILGLLVVFARVAQELENPDVDATVDAIIARDFPDGLEPFCQLLGKQSDAGLAAARSKWIEDHNGNQPPPGLVWDELITRC